MREDLRACRVVKRLSYLFRLPYFTASPTIEASTAQIIDGYLGAIRVVHGRVRREFVFGVVRPVVGRIDGPPCECAYSPVGKRVGSVAQQERRSERRQMHFYT